MAKKDENPKKLIGAFYFRNDGDGCITGKYFNTGLPSPLVEAAKMVSAAVPPVLFCGIYHTVWLDTLDEASGLVELQISPKSGATGIFELKWYNPNNHDQIYFFGEGMIAEGWLVGCYWNHLIMPDGHHTGQVSTI